MMTWNLLHETPCEEEIKHPWRDRAAVARMVIQRERPHLLCCQEAYPRQLDDLLENLPDHWWVGRDRDGRNDGEACPIVFDTGRLRLREWEQFWLGPTPTRAGSLTWTNDVPRAVTLARFEDLRTGARFTVANTHMDHLVPSTRTKSIELLRKRLPKGTIEEPLVLAGDFNSPAWAKPHRLLVRGPDRFHDTYHLARDGEGPLAGTFHHFKGKGFARFDWILVQPRLEVPRLRILRDAPGGRFPSDHFPVLAEILLPHAASAATEARAPVAA